MPVLCWQRVKLGELRGEGERPMGVVAILKCAGIDCAVCKRFPWLKREASVKTSFCHPAGGNPFAKHIWLKDFSNDIMGSVTSFRFYSFCKLLLLLVSVTVHITNKPKYGFWYDWQVASICMRSITGFLSQLHPSRIPKLWLASGSVWWPIFPHLKPLQVKPWAKGASFS